MRAALGWILSLLLVAEAGATFEDFRKEVRLIRRAYLDTTGLLPTETELDWFLVYERRGYPHAVEFLTKEGPRGGFTREMLLSEDYRNQPERLVPREDLERNVLYLTGKLRAGETEGSFDEAAAKFVEDAMLAGEGRVGETINYMAQALLCRPSTAEEETQLTRIHNQVSLKSEEQVAFKTVLLHILEMHDCKFK
jgi:hypothetical protein